MNDKAQQLKEELADSRAEAMMVLSKMVNHYVDTAYPDKELLNKISEIELQINDLAKQMQKLMYEQIEKDVK